MSSRGPGLVIPEPRPADAPASFSQSHVQAFGPEVVQRRQAADTLRAITTSKSADLSLVITLVNLYTSFQRFLMSSVPAVY